MNAAPASCPALVLAVLVRMPALEARLAFSCPGVTVARSYRMVGGAAVVTLRLTCDPQSDWLRRDEDNATATARDHLLAAGFTAHVEAACMLRVTGARAEAPEVQIPAEAA